MPHSEERESPETESLLARAAEGDSDATSLLLSQHEHRLRRMVEARLDRRLRARIDPADVMQDVALEAVRRLPRFLAERDMPFFLWLRFLTAQHLAKLCQIHLDARLRDVRREEAGLARYAASSSDCLAAQIAAGQPSPTEIARSNEQREILERAIDALEAEDREVISLRHHEQLSNTEAARELGIEPAAASKRFIRALQRLRQAVTAAGGEPSGLNP